MAEIRYSGVPSQVVPGLGAKLQENWANFALAELPQGLIKAQALPGASAANTERQKLIKALMKLLQEEEKETAGSIVTQLAPLPPGSLG